LAEVIAAIAAAIGAVAAVISALKAGEASNSATTLGIGVDALTTRVSNLQQQIQRVEQTIAVAQQQRQQQQVYTGNIYNTGTVIQQVSGGAAVAAEAQATEQIAAQDGTVVEWPQIPLEALPQAQEPDPESQEES
jgi:hypothetical protein